MTHDLDARGWKARAERAEAEVELRKEQQREDYAAHRHLKEENKRLRLALEFYASDEPWTREAIEGNHGDWGMRAREALAVKKDAPG